MHDRVESELRPEGTNRLRHWLAMVGAEGGKSGTLTVTGYPEIADRMSPEGSSGCVGMRTATQRSFVCWSSRRRCRPLHDAGARQQSRRDPRHCRRAGHAPSRLVGHGKLHHDDETVFPPPGRRLRERYRPAAWWQSRMASGAVAENELHKPPARSLSQPPSQQWPQGRKLASPQAAGF